MYSITIPEHLIGHTFQLPFVPEKKVHAKEPSALAIHRMLGFSDQAPGRTAALIRFPDGSYQILVDDGKGRGMPGLTRLHPPLFQRVAVMSSLEGYAFEQAMERLRKEEHDSLSLIPCLLQIAANKIMNGWNETSYAHPWTGVGIIPVSPDGEEFAFVRKDHLHPCPGYCGRLALVGGALDPHELLSGWGDDVETAHVAALRELFEKIRDTQIALEIAQAMQYGDTSQVRCYLSETNGQATAGVMRTFVAFAPDVPTWDRWRKIFTPESDGLGKATPALIGRQELEEALRNDDEVGAERARHLAMTLPEQVMQEARFLVEGYSSATGMSDEEWLSRREAGLLSGAFPTQDRGDFTFISGMHEAVEDALVEQEIL